VLPEPQGKSDVYNDVSSFCEQYIIVGLAQKLVRSRRFCGDDRSRTRHQRRWSPPDRGRQRRPGLFL